MPSHDPWGNYWRSGALTTFGDKPTYQGELRDLWTGFLKELADGAVLVDLGAGNGALEEIVQQYCMEHAAHMTVHAVDAAKVSPQVTSTDAAACEVIWHPKTRNEATGLPEASVDAVIGSYAFEYGDDPGTVREIARILKPGGRCRFLMHHAESVLITDTAGEIAVLDTALAKNGLFDLAETFLREFGNIRKKSHFDKLRKSGKADSLLQRLDAAHSLAAGRATTPNSQVLLTTLARGLSTLITPPALLQPRPVLLEHLANARREYEANHARLRDMKNAQVDSQRMQEISGLFETAGMQVDAKPFHVTGFDDPAGWIVDVIRQ